MEPLVLLTHLMDSARRLGARAAEGLIEQRHQQGLTWKPPAPIVADQKTGISLQFRVYMQGGHMGRAAATGASLDTLDHRVGALLNEAIARAASSTPDPFAGPADRYDIDARGQGLLDRRLPQIRASDRRALLEENMEAISRVPELRPVQARYEETYLSRSFASSRGVAATEESSRFDAFCTALHVDRGRPMTEGVASRQFANAVSIPFGTELAKRLVSLQKATALPGTPWPVFIPPRLTARLMQEIAPAFVATEARQGRSFLGPLVGQHMANVRLHVIDDPGVPGALYSRAFDDRGVPPIPVVLIREGRASGLLYDLQSARAEHIPPTGHTVGDRAEASNIVVRSGTRTRNAIGMDIGDYLVLDELGDSPAVDVATGLIHSNCDVLVCRANEVVGAVQDLPLSTSVVQLLSDICDVADDQARYANVDSCSLVLKSLPFPPGSVA
jgi:predicted Zn-dependent protease